MTGRHARVGTAAVARLIRDSCKRCQKPWLWRSHCLVFCFFCFPTNSNWVKINTPKPHTPHPWPSYTADTCSPFTSVTTVALRGRFGSVGSTSVKTERAAVLFPTSRVKVLIFSTWRLSRNIKVVIHTLYIDIFLFSLLLLSRIHQLPPSSKKKESLAWSIFFVSDEKTFNLDVSSEQTNKNTPKDPAEVCSLLFLFLLLR